MTVTFYQITEIHPDDAYYFPEEIREEIIGTVFNLDKTPNSKFPRITPAYTKEPGYVFVNYPNIINSNNKYLKNAGSICFYAVKIKKLKM